MKSFYKLEVESTLWRKFKVKCAAEGETMLSVLIRLIENYVSNNNGVEK